MRQMRNKFKMSYLPSVSVLFFLLLLDTIVLADYENTWNSYFEQPCCNTNGPHHFRHHKGINSLDGLGWKLCQGLDILLGLGACLEFSGNFPSQSREISYANSRRIFAKLNKRRSHAEN